VLFTTEGPPNTEVNFALKLTTNAPAIGILLNSPLTFLLYNLPY